MKLPRGEMLLHHPTEALIRNTRTRQSNPQGKTPGGGNVHVQPDARVPAWPLFGAGSSARAGFGWLCKLVMNLDLPVRYFELPMRQMEGDPRVETVSGKPWFVPPQRGASSVLTSMPACSWAIWPLLPGSTLRGTL